MDPDDLRRQLELVLERRRRRPGRPAARTSAVIARRTSRSAARRRSSEPDRHRGDARAPWRSGRAGGSPSRACRRPSTRAGRSRRRCRRRPHAGRRRWPPCRRRSSARRAAAAPRTDQTASRSRRARPLPRLPARAPGERDGGDQDQHREREVTHHEAGREVVADGEAAEHRLADDAERQQQRRSARGRGGTGAGGTRAARRRQRRARPGPRAAGCRTRSPRASPAAARPCRSTSASPGSRGPEPESRTAAPVKTISVRKTSASSATWRYWRGVRVRRSGGASAAHCGERSPAPVRNRASTARYPETVPSAAHRRQSSSTACPSASASPRSRCTRSRSARCTRSASSASTASTRSGRLVHGPARRVLRHRRAQRIGQEHAAEVPRRDLPAPTPGGSRRRPALDVHRARRRLQPRPRGARQRVINGVMLGLTPAEARERFEHGHRVRRAAGVRRPEAQELLVRHAGPAGVLGRRSRSTPTSC